jgi:hypothetical protein
VVPNRLFAGFSAAGAGAESAPEGGLAELWPKTNGVAAGAGLSCGAGAPKLNVGLGAAVCGSPPNILFAGLSCAGWLVDGAGCERKENGLAAGLSRDWVAPKLVAGCAGEFGAFCWKANGLLAGLAVEFELKLNRDGDAGCDEAGWNENMFSAGFSCVLAWPKMLVLLFWTPPKASGVWKSAGPSAVWKLLSRRRISSPVVSGL